MCSYRYSSVLVTQSSLTLCDPIDCSPSGSSVHGILWSGLPCPPPGDLPNPGIKSWSSPLQADSLPFEPSGKPILLTGRYVCIFQALIFFSFSFRWLALLEIQICIILIFYYYDCSLLDPLPKQVNLQNFE